VLDKLGAEEAGEHASVGGEPGQRDACTVGDAEDLACWGELKGGVCCAGEDYGGGGAEADASIEQVIMEAEGRTLSPPDLLGTENRRACRRHAAGRDHGSRGD
jgi:hypothetical protein